MDNQHVQVNITNLFSSTTVSITLQVAAVAKPIDRKHINGVTLPTEENSRNRSRNRGNLAAIDFGTANCSVAYCMEGDENVRLLRFGDDVRVPTAILVDATNGTVVEFGKNARRKYVNLPSERKQHYHLFTEINMNLQEVAWTHTVKSKLRYEFFTIEVIALILKYLKDKLLNSDELVRGPTGAVEALDFHWIITVPAMWKARGKQMMREAAYMAGIANDGDEISRLTNAIKEGGHFKSIPYKPMEVCIRPESLSLALKPEVAALHCINQAKEQNLPIAQSTCYIVLDIRGRTVDITAHKVTDGCIEVMLPPKGNDWGGNRVNEEFKKFLASLVDDQNFDRYLFTGIPEITSKNFADLDRIIFLDFEKQKQCFGDKGICDDDALINFPYSFMMKYKDDLERGIQNLDSSDVRLSENELVISYRKMAEFFEKAITEITSCVVDCVREVNENHKLESVFFVGGFGGCKYLHDRVKEVLGDDIDTFCPRDHKTAIVRGAVLFGQNPSIIKSRIADATYGVTHPLPMPLDPALLVAGQQMYHPSSAPGGLVPPPLHHPQPLPMVQLVGSHYPTAALPLQPHISQQPLPPTGVPSLPLPSSLPDIEPDKVDMFMWLSDNLVGWPFIARYLGFGEPMIERVKEENPHNVSEQCYQMFNKWYRQRPSEFSCRKLGEALFKSERNRHLYSEFVKRVMDQQQQQDMDTQ